MTKIQKLLTYTNQCARFGGKRKALDFTNPEDQKFITAFIQSTLDAIPEILTSQAERPVAVTVVPAPNIVSLTAPETERSSHSPDENPAPAGNDEARGGKSDSVRTPARAAARPSALIASRIAAAKHGRPTSAKTVAAAPVATETTTPGSEPA